LSSASTISTGDRRDYLARLDAALAGRIWHLPRGHRWRWHGRDWLALGGAVSLDRGVRTAGVNWWPEEEITWRQAGPVSPQPGSWLTRVCRRRLIGCPARQLRWHWGRAFHLALAPRAAGAPREGRP
jgi:hypothetical protein